MTTPPPPLIVGQQYVCESSRPERRLEAIVGRLDSVTHQETIVSVSLMDKGADAAIPEAGHLPFSEAAFRSSCRTLLASDVVVPSGFEEGYRIWRAAFDSGKGGYYTISVDQAVDVMIATLKRGEREP